MWVLWADKWRTEMTRRTTNVFLTRIEPIITNPSRQVNVHALLSVLPYQTFS